MLTYPTSLDDAPAELLTFYRTKAFTPRTLRAALHTVCFGVGMVYPDVATASVAEAVTVIQKSGARPMSEDDLEQALRTLDDQSDGEKADLKKAVDWKSLILAVLQLVLKVIA